MSLLSLYPIKHLNEFFALHDSLLETSNSLTYIYLDIYEKNMKKNKNKKKNKNIIYISCDLNFYITFLSYQIWKFMNKAL